MEGPRFFVPELEPGRVRLSRDDSRHALRSLRIRPGEAVTVSDGRGLVGPGRLVGEESGTAIVEVDHMERVERPDPVVTVLVAPPAGDRLRWMVQKLTEVGVDRVWMMRSERSVRAAPADRAEKALARLEAVAREAAMQSRRARLVELGWWEGEMGELDSGIGADPADRARLVVLHQQADLRLRDLLPDAPPPEVVVAVGPEGGFSDGEVHRAASAGAAVGSLGPAVLRTETAAVIGTALVLARYGRLG